jgi:hypothetical protein
MNNSLAYMRGEKEIIKDRTRNGGYKDAVELLTIPPKKSVSMKENWRLTREGIKNA